MNERYKAMSRRLHVARDAHLSNIEGLQSGGTTTVGVQDIRNHAAVLSEAAAMLAEKGKPAGYLFELAKAKLLDGSGYCLWGEQQYARYLPDAPSGSMRNIIPVYELSDHVPAQASPTVAESRVPGVGSAEFVKAVMGVEWTPGGTFVNDKAVIAKGAAIYLKVKLSGGLWTALSRQDVSRPWAIIGSGYDCEEVAKADALVQKWAQFFGGGE